MHPLQLVVSLQDFFEQILGDVLLGLLLFFLLLIILIHQLLQDVLNGGVARIEVLLNSHIGQLLVVVQQNLVLFVELPIDLLELVVLLLQLLDLADHQLQPPLHLLLDLIDVGGGFVPVVEVVGLHQSLLQLFFVLVLQADVLYLAYLCLGLWVEIVDAGFFVDRPILIRPQLPAGLLIGRGSWLALVENFLLYLLYVV